MKEKIERKRFIILKILQDADKPLSSQKIMLQLKNMGFQISERTVRFHMLALDKEGYTSYIEKKGRQLTPKGQLELSRSHVYQQLGFLSSKIDQLTYMMDFNLAKKTGRVVVNISLIETKYLKKAVPLITSVFDSGFSMGNLLGLFHSGDVIGNVRIPDGFVGIGTVCSITLNGILLSEGIPVTSIFGGLLEIKDFRPERFIAIIRYDGTSLDPLEVYIKSGMTDTRDLKADGVGHVGVSFREIPAASRDKVIEIAEKMNEAGIGNFLEIGWPGIDMLDVPMGDGRVGLVVPGGLNSVGILEESGIPVYSRAMTGLVEYDSLFHYKDLAERVKIF